MPGLSSLVDNVVMELAVDVERFGLWDRIVGFSGVQRAGVRLHEVERLAELRGIEAPLPEIILDKLAVIVEVVRAYDADEIRRQNEEIENRNNTT